MTRYFAVIGANYGDEGKGRTVDWLCRRLPDPLVIKHNGGAQAGHTVIDRNRRHVFSQIGAGAFSGASTFLARTFMFDPLAFADEARELDLPDVIFVGVDVRCRVVTPMDCFYNQLTSLPNTTCGMGINVAVNRVNEGVDLRVNDLVGNELVDKLAAIRAYYVNAVEHDAAFLDAFNGTFPEEHMKNLAEAFRSVVESRSLYLGYDVDVMMSYPNVVFEGAQGLGLDEVNGEFPNVTRSRTGLVNPLTMCGAYAEELDAYFVTRSYLTRHGEGPLDRESEPIEPQEDETNGPNLFQGAMRFASLDPFATGKRVGSELLRHEHGPTRIKAHLVVTCTDQVEPDDEQYARLQHGVAASARGKRFSTVWRADREGCEEWRVENYWLL